MANNRMYLRHPPSGLTISLGKRMGSGYYQPPSSEGLQAFYDAVERWIEDHGADWRMDDFVVDYEIEANTI
jgi:hypothetical protein